MRDRNDDVALVALLLVGGDGAKLALASAYGFPLFTYVDCETSHGLPEEDVADIVSKACEKAVAKIRQFLPQRAKFSTWIYRIARNEAIDFVRREKRRTALFVKTSESYEARRVPSASNPYAELEQKETSEKLHSAIEQLPNAQRLAVIARYIHGLSYEDAAIRLDVSPGTFGSLLHRGMERLKPILSAAGLDPHSSNKPRVLALIDTDHRISTKPRGDPVDPGSHADSGLSAAAALRRSRP